MFIIQATAFWLIKAKGEQGLRVVTPITPDSPLFLMYLTDMYYINKGLDSQVIGYNLSLFPEGRVAFVGHTDGVDVFEGVR
jgi:hypothetical protein